MDEVPGIGPKPRKQLLLNFGNVAKMKQATQGELSQAPGMNDGLAETLYDYLHDATRG